MLPGDRLLLPSQAVITDAAGPASLAARVRAEVAVRDLGACLDL